MTAPHNAAITTPADHREEIAELTIAADWKKAFAVFKAFRPKLDKDTFLRRREELSARGYRLFALTISGEVVAVAGMQILPHILRSSELRVNDLATDPDKRSQGFGAKLMAHLERVAKENQCSRILLYSGNWNTGAHQFYERQGFVRYGVEFVKEL